VIRRLFESDGRAHGLQSGRLPVPGAMGLEAKWRVEPDIFKLDRIFGWRCQKGYNTHVGRVGLGRNGGDDIRPSFIFFF